MRRIEKYISF